MPKQHSRKYIFGWKPLFSVRRFCIPPNACLLKQQYRNPRLRIWRIKHDKSGSHKTQSTWQRLENGMDHNMVHCWPFLSVSDRHTLVSGDPGEDFICVLRPVHPVIAKLIQDVLLQNVPAIQYGRYHGETFICTFSLIWCYYLWQCLVMAQTEARFINLK